MSKQDEYLGAHEEPVCIRCYGTGYPVSTGPGWSMGMQKPMRLVAKKLQKQLSWGGKEDMRNAYLCGNCYFDMTDEF